MIFPFRFGGVAPTTSLQVQSTQRFSFKSPGLYPHPGLSLARENSCAGAARYSFTLMAISLLRASSP